jgi:hypothetical protein
MSRLEDGYYDGGDSSERKPRETYMFTTADGIKKIRAHIKLYDVRPYNGFMQKYLEVGKIIKFKNVEEKGSNDTVECKITSVKPFPDLEAVLEHLGKKNAHHEIGAGAEVNEIKDNLMEFVSGAKLVDRNDGSKLDVVLFGFTCADDKTAHGGRARRRSKSKPRAKAKSRSRSRGKGKSKK